MSKGRLRGFRCLAMCCRRGGLKLKLSELSDVMCDGGLVLVVLVLALALAGPSLQKYSAWVDGWMEDGRTSTSTRRTRP